MNRTLTRSRFVDNAVATAGPQQILTMLYDRLVLDIARAEQSQRAGDRSAAAAQLDHAGDIVLALASTLDTGSWSAGTSLMDLYTFLVAELMACSLAGDPERTARCGALVTPLRDAWHEAVASLAASARATIPSPRTTSAFGEPSLGGEVGIG